MAQAGVALNGARPIRKICVYCGASNGKNPQYIQAAQELGRELVNRKISLVYGGGTVGLMGELARTVVDGLGEEAVIGVIPADMMPREVSGEMIGNTRVVKDMHERKAEMSRLADAFITLPGGFGTLEEMMEMITWQQIGYHDKPIGLLNVGGYYDYLLKLFDHMQDEGFVRPASRRIVLSATRAEDLIDALLAYQAPASLLQLAREGRLDANVRG